MNTRQAHDAVFAEGTTYFIYSFDAGRPLDVQKVADQLLRSGMAETVVSPRSGRVRVAHRYRDLVRLVRRTSALQELDRAFRERRLRRWMIRHPIWAVRIIGRSYLPRSRRPEGGEGRRSEDILDSLASSINFIQEAVAREQSVNAVQHDMERRLLRAPYLQSEPYLRLHLRSAGQWLTRLNGGALRAPGDISEGIEANVLLLIHRSGVMQLTIALKLPDEISVEQYRELAFGSSEVVAASWIAEPVLRAAYGRGVEDALPGRWEEEIKAGVRWRTLQHEAPVSMSDLFLLYAEGISRVIGSQWSGDWFCYPATFIDRVDCCESEEQFRRLHEVELKNAIMRDVDFSEVRPEQLDSLLPDEGALTRNTSLYCNMSSSMRFAGPVLRVVNFSSISTG